MTAYVGHNSRRAHSADHPAWIHLGLPIPVSRGPAHHGTTSTVPTQKIFIAAAPIPPSIRQSTHHLKPLHKIERTAQTQTVTCSPHRHVRSSFRLPVLPADVLRILSAARGMPIR